MTFERWQREFVRAMERMGATALARRYSSNPGLRRRAMVHYIQRSDPAVAARSEINGAFR